MRKLLFLNPVQRFGDFALLLLRVFVGLFLIWSVWDKVTSSEDMREYSEFLAKHDFANPGLLAPLLVYLLLAIGAAFVLGLFTRWAGIFCVIVFSVAIAMVDRHGGMRGIFPSACLVGIGLYLATHGAGRFSVDEALNANQQPRANGGVRFKL